MIYSPIGLQPSNTAINPLTNNSFSWINRGSPQSSYRLKILKNEDNTVIYDTTQLTSSNTSHVVPSGTLTAGINYKWNVQVWYGSSTATSQYSFIQSSSLPTIEFFDPDFNSPPVVLPGQNYLFKALYSQAEDISISKFKYILYDENDNIILDTGYIYGFTPEYEFEGMIRSNTYKVECIAVSQNGLTCTTGKQEFSIDTFSIPDTTPDIDVISNDTDASITVSWGDLKLVTPIVSGTYSYVPAKFNEGLLLDDSSEIDFQETVTPDSNILSGWYKFTYGQDGDFVKLGSDVFGGFEYSTQRFYIRNGINYTYSNQIGLYTVNDFGTLTIGDLVGDFRNPAFNPTDIINNWFFIAINNTMEMVTYFNDVFAFAITTNIPVSNSFASIKFFGKLLIDNIRANNQSMTITEINNIDKTTPQLWIVPTNWLANFNNSLESGNISNNVPITGWRLKRKKTGEDLFVTISDFPKTTREFTDRTPANNTEYTYSVFSLSSEGEGLGLEGIGEVSFFGWFLINQNTEKWFKFDAGWDGIDTGDIDIQQGSFIYDKQSKFPTVSYGLQNFRKGKINAVPYIVNGCDVIIDKSVLDEVKQLILDKDVKILKNSFGDVMIVNTLNMKFKHQDKIYQQPFEVDFEWVEVDENNLTE
jgi:hypothetical protein